MKTRDSRFHIHKVVEALDIGEELFWEPSRIVPPGDWAGHLAVAFWLVKAVRPDVFVELGIEDGNAYAAFCQGVAHFGLSTRCLAVDARKSKEASRHVGVDAFAELSAFNDQHYAAFSELLQGSFDEARRRFPGAGEGGGVDLLHIDNTHGTDAAKHAFESWKSALSSRAVVVLHGIDMPESASGVGTLWKELSQQYPSFAFDHADGLGLLGVGRAQQPLMQRLFGLAEIPLATHVVRHLFASRGETFRSRVRMLDLEHHIESLSAEIHRIGQTDQRAQPGTGARKSRGPGASATHGPGAAGHSESIEEAQQLKSEHERAQTEWSDERQRLVAEGERLARMLSAQQLELARELRQVRANEERLRDDLAHAFRSSASWRITAPLRAATGVLRKLSGPRGTAKAPVSPPEPSAGQARSPAGLSPRAAMRSVFATRLNVFLTASGMLRLPSHPTPDVSIVLVLYNQAELTFSCLASIAEVTNGSELSVEVVILDNGSADATANLLERVEGANIIRSPENLHFLRGANRGAREARGKYLLFLNNDALLMPGALEAAFRASEADAAIGAVGGRIVLPDGTLQEAGSIVWRDGTCTGYGRGGPPDAAEFMYRRDVDYCSGAFLLTPRKLFESLGGFDERYAPAYYEETDYCLRLWQAGRRVVFDPDIVILHLEFGSSTTSEQALELQRRNSAIFRERHAEWLKDQRLHAPADLLGARSARSNAQRILFIEDRVPHPKLGAGYPRSNELLRELAETGAELTLFPMYRHAETWEGIRRSVPASVEVMYDYSAADLGAFLQERRNHYNAILVCRPHNMREFLAATQGRPELVGNAHVFYDAEALFASRKLLERELAGEKVSAREADRMIAEEMALTRTADAIVSVSPREKAQFEAHGVGPVFILGHTIEAAPTVTPFEERTDLLFVGAIHGDDAPNADSLRWFANEIWPHLREELGEVAHLKVVGFNRAASIAKLAGCGLDLIGPVDDLRPWFERARIVVAPTRIAAGIPLKVYEAAAAGVPTVTTDLLASQTGWKPGQDLLAANSASGFATACARLYRDRQLWEAIRRSALERVVHDCSRERFRSAVRQLLASISQPPALSHKTPAIGSIEGQQAAPPSPASQAAASTEASSSGLHLKQQ